MTRPALLDLPPHDKSPRDPLRDDPLVAARAVEPETTAPEESMRLLSWALRSQLLRGVASDVASAIAHAAGTPLNVITGRAELIRQDPANAATHATRIEEQVRRLANGFRQLVDYLALAETPPSETPAGRVAADALEFALPLARERGVELALDVSALNALTVDGGHVLGVLSLLLEWAIEQVARTKSGTPRQLLLMGTRTEDAVIFEFEIAALEPLSGWRLEHFEARPGATPDGEAYRTLSLCGALARGHGSRLSTEAAENGQGVRVRLSCLPGAGV